MSTVRKSIKRHPQLTGELDRVIHKLESDPYDPRLMLHPLTGRHKGKHSVRLKYSNRIVMTLAVSEGELTLLDIGSHDDVYRA